MTENNGIRTCNAGNLKVNIYNNRKAMGEAAAAMVADKINSLHEQQELVNMVFASAPSQNEFLAALDWRTKVDWSRVNAFHMDEYIELPADDPRTFKSFLNKKIFGRLPFHS